MTRESHRLRPHPLAWPAIAAIRLYQFTLSPLLGGQCRYEPSCSRYALLAFQTHPPWTAAWLTLRRLGRCHPLGGSGYDPVPVPEPPPTRARTTGPAGTDRGRKRRRCPPVSVD